MDELKNKFWKQVLSDYGHIQQSYGNFLGLKVIVDKLGPDFIKDDIRDILRLLYADISTFKTSYPVASHLLKDSFDEMENTYAPYALSIDPSIISEAQTDSLEGKIEDKN